MVLFDADLEDISGSSCLIQIVAADNGRGLIHPQFVYNLSSGEVRVGEAPRIYKMFHGICKNVSRGKTRF